MKTRKTPVAPQPQSQPQPASTPEPCFTCGPGEVRASHFPSTLRLWEQRKGGVADTAKEAQEALSAVSGSVTWLMLEDLVEQRRDEFITSSLEAVSAEAAAAYTFRAQGAETVLRTLRLLRATRTTKAEAPTT